MKDLKAKLSAYDWGGDRGALYELDELIKNAQADAKKLVEIERALLEALESGVKVAAVDYICRQLALIGTRRSVPALAKLLQDETLSDRALYALDGIPENAAGRALRKALSTTEGDLRVGIVNSLGERHDEKAIPALKTLRDDPDVTLARAVESALRKIRN
jgi:HEAT repeat protein